MQSYIFVQQMNPLPRYRFEFSYDAAFGHAVRMILRLKPSGLIMDLGCGYGPLAEPLHLAGYSYVGVDLDPQAVADLENRGFEAYQADLALLSQPGDSGPPQLASFLGEVAAGRQVGAVLALDVIEHLADPDSFLLALRQALLELDRPLLILSVPNVAHYDLAAKLLLGRFETTPTGLLDESHLRFFTHDRLRELTCKLGWLEVDSEDVTTNHSDQHFPEDLPTLAEGTPLNELLSRLRSSADPYGSTYQFVRAYALASDSSELEEATSPIPPRSVLTGGSKGDYPEVLSVVILTTCADERSLAATVQSLCAQRQPISSTWMVEPLIAVVRDPTLVLDHRGQPAALTAARRIVDELSSSQSTLLPLLVLGEQPKGGVGAQPYGSRARALQAGLEAAQGRLVLFIDDTLSLPPDFLEAVVTTASTHPGSPLRTGEGSDLLSMLAGGDVYLPAYVLPKQGVDSLGLEFDESFFPYEHCLFVLEALAFLGEIDLPLVHGPTPHGVGGTNSALLGRVRSGGDPERQARRERLREYLASHPLPIQAGLLPNLVDILSEAEESKERIAELELANQALLSSTSWRITEPLRRISGQLRTLWKW